MKLSDFLKYDRICIQCHDNPDADSLASGYAIFMYFKSKGKNIRFIYSGSYKITKANLILMVERLNIPIEYVDNMPKCDLLIITDCQYGEGNVKKFNCDNIAVIDHHQYNGSEKENYYILSNYGSCSTVVWTLLQWENFDVNAYENVATALYYGLYCDTGQLSEIYLPADKDLRDTMKFNKGLLNLLVNTNLSLEEMRITGDALSSYHYNDDNRFAIIKARPCDPNILGIISDLAIQVDNIDKCVVYNKLKNGYKLSIRSCIKETKANDLAEYICKDIGSGGGHISKAGGYVKNEDFELNNLNMDFEKYIVNRILQYNKEYEIIYAKYFNADICKMDKYIKNKLVVGVVETTDVLKEGTPIIVRTLEGDLETIVSKNLYIMIGINGEVYPITKEKFNSSYQLTDNISDISWEYEPRIRNIIDGNVYKLGGYIKNCVATGDTYIYAKELTKKIKVFTNWDENSYLRGLEGDYIAVRSDDIKDVYVVEKTIFYKTYKKIKQGN